MLLYDHRHVIESEAGVQQGDPLGPLYFCCGINGLVNEIGALGVRYSEAVHFMRTTPLSQWMAQGQVRRDAERSG